MHVCHVNLNKAACDIRRVQRKGCGDCHYRGDALGFLELLTTAAPGDMEAEFLFPALQHYADLLSPATRGRSVSSGSLTSLHQVTFQF